MRLPRITILGIIVLAVSACFGGTSAGSPYGAASPTPTATDDPVMYTVLFTSLSASQACSLLTVAEAGQILGRQLEGAPAGLSDRGDHVQCLYQDQGNQVPGNYIKVAINRIGFDGLAGLVNLHRGAHTLEIGGFQAIGADAETSPVNDEAVLSIKLARNDSDPALWIEAPTSASAKAVADLILPRLAALP